MYHRVRRKMKYIVFGAILLLSSQSLALPRALDIPQKFPDPILDELDNNIIDFDDDFSVKYNKKWQGDIFNKDSYRYSVTKDDIKHLSDNSNLLKNTENNQNKPNFTDKTHITTISGKSSPEIEQTTELTVIPLELISTTENALVKLVESTAEPDLTVIPLTTTEKVVLNVVINQTATLPTSTQLSEDTTITTETVETTIKDLTTTQVITKSNSTDDLVTEQPVTEVDDNITSTEVTTEQDYTTEKYLEIIYANDNTTKISLESSNVTGIITKSSINDEISTDDKRNVTTENYPFTTTDIMIANDTSKDNDSILANDTSGFKSNSSEIVEKNSKSSNATDIITNSSIHDQISTDDKRNVITENYPFTTTDVIIADDTTTHNDSLDNDSVIANGTTDFKSNSSEVVEIEKRDKLTELNDDIPIYTELDVEDSSDVPEDYYDSKDLVPTTSPKTDALSVIFGFAGSVVESMVETVAERVVPKGIVDLFRRMQKQNEALEAERLRSREENGGLGQFTRGIIKTISSGLGKPLSQLMAGVRDYGSLDSDRGFLNSLASGVTSVANAAYSMADAFKDRVQTIYPGTVWCGGGHSAQARSSDLGLFFFTDTCCRQHDSCKLYIASGETKYGLTNTGLFTRSHCSCDLKFRECLRRTNSLVSAQIGLTYFNVLGPQCFRRAHPIVRCVRRTRITGQKCEEYELDYTKPKMWQWFDNETF